MVKRRNLCAELGGWTNRPEPISGRIRRGRSPELRGSLNVWSGRAGDQAERGQEGLGFEGVFRHAENRTRTVQGETWKTFEKCANIRVTRLLLTK